MLQKLEVKFQNTYCPLSNIGRIRDSCRLYVLTFFFNFAKKIIVFEKENT